jgi:hypothetical protein
MDGLLVDKDSFVGRIVGDLVGDAVGDVVGDAVGDTVVGEEVFIIVGLELGICVLTVIVSATLTACSPVTCSSGVAAATGIGLSVGVVIVLNDNTKKTPVTN